MQNDDLIQLFLEGDARVLNDIYKTSFPYVKHYITSRDGSKKDAEDIFHNALLLIYVKLKEGKIQIQSFENYLFTVCKNLWKRECSKKEVTNQQVVPLVSETLDLAKFYLEQNQWELFEEKFKLLSEKCQEILKMIFEKKSYEAIVQKYKYASFNAARQRVFKCKTRLAKLIQKDERFSQLKNKKWN